VAAAQTATSSTVVPAGGQVAGQGYGQWLRNSWQRAFADLPDASACQTQRTPAGAVALLLGGYSGKAETHTCRLRANAPIYVNGLSVECSTIEQPPFHGNTPAELKRCARRDWRGATHLSASIDGRRVRGYRTLITASPVYAFQLPKHNILGTTQRSGRSAAYGEGLLLRGLSAGTHTVHITGTASALGFTEDVTYLLQMQPAS
jgi:hypothetical protein